MLKKLVLLALLAACSRASAPISHRDADAPISSAVIFDAQRFGGAWRVAASTARGCAGAEQRWAFDGGGYALSGTSCAATKPARLKGRIDITGPGARFTGSGFGGEPVWLLWVDQDYRVAALGTPSGAFGMILTRPEIARDDLMRAAREVMDFNGYGAGSLN